MAFHLGAKPGNQLLAKQESERCCPQGSHSNSDNPAAELALCIWHGWCNTPQLSLRVLDFQAEYPKASWPPTAPVHSVLETPNIEY
jgi:hypothetical protein